MQRKHGPKQPNASLHAYNPISSTQIVAGYQCKLNLEMGCYFDSRGSSPSKLTLNAVEQLADINTKTRRNELHTHWEDNVTTIILFHVDVRSTGTGYLFWCALGTGSTTKVV